MNNIAYLLALHSIDGLGPIRLKAVLDYFKDSKLAWDGESRKFLEIGIPKNVVDLFLETRKKFNPEAYMQSILDKQIKWVTIFDPDYPEILKQIYDPPTVLYYRGEILESDKNAIGIVGTRKITGYGKAVTENFTEKLSRANFTIVSGLARGVDSIAHTKTIQVSGRTIAVLGGGLNNIFPSENVNLAKKIAEGFGAVISEFPPDHPSLPGNFPSRNRIIAGLSKAVLVTEAASDSGSLITARVAAEYGRDVFAVPGPVTSTLSKGPIELIKEGARIVFEPEDILEELGVDPLKKVEKINIESLPEDERKILEFLTNQTLHLDEIGRALRYPSSKISGLLLKMEISGLVQNLGSGNYCSNNLA